MSYAQLPPPQPASVFAPKPQPRPTSKHGPFLWLFIGAAMLALVLGGLWAWSEVRIAQMREATLELVNTVADTVTEYEDAIADCQESVSAWVDFAQAQSDTISAYGDGLRSFFSSWDYRAGDVSVIYEGVDKVSSAQDAAFNAATATSCTQP